MAIESGPARLLSPSHRNDPLIPIVVPGCSQEATGGSTRAICSGEPKRTARSREGEIGLLEFQGSGPQAHGIAVDRPLVLRRRQLEGFPLVIVTRPPVHQVLQPSVGGSRWNEYPTTCSATSRSTTSRSTASRSTASRSAASRSTWIIVAPGVMRRPPCTMWRIAALRFRCDHRRIDGLLFDSLGTVTERLTLHAPLDPSILGAVTGPHRTTGIATPTGLPPGWPRSSRTSHAMNSKFRIRGDSPSSRPAEIRVPVRCDNLTDLRHTIYNWYEVWTAVCAQASAFRWHVGWVHHLGTYRGKLPIVANVTPCCRRCSFTPVRPREVIAHRPRDLTLPTEMQIGKCLRKVPVTTERTQVYRLLTP